MLKSAFEQPDAESMHRQYQEVCAALDGKFPDALTLLESAETDVLAFTPFPVKALETNPFQ
jgi:transposase-like protein